MFFWQKKKTPPPQHVDTIVFNLDGMHCVSCSLNIDGALEDTPGVKMSGTSYAKGTTTITYDRALVSPEDLKAVIEGLGYRVK